MRRSIWRVVTAAWCLLAIASACGGATIWDYEAVNEYGTGSHPLVNAAAYDSGENVIQSNKVTIEGVALAGMNDLWNGESSQYVLFVQDDTYSRGGIEVWAGNFGWYQPPVVWRPAQYAPFGAGDRVRVTGFLGDHAGKVFINDRHCNDLDVCFTVEVIGHPGLPDPEVIPSVANCNYFDQTRNDGGERYQTRLTMLHGVQVTGGSWAPGSTLTIGDATGATSLYLAPLGAFSGDAPSGKISIVGIYDQEDGGTGDPVRYHGNYRMILRNPNDVATALDACREVRDRVDGEKVALVGKVVSRVYSGCFFIQDADRTGGVRVVSDRPVTPGDVVGVMGIVATQDGEKVITAQYVANGRTAAKPLVVNANALRGQTGLDVFGLVVRCVGRIGNDLGNGRYGFVVDSGDDITLVSNGYAVPAQGTLVAVTAVASGSPSAPVLLLGSASDVQSVE